MGFFVLHLSFHVDIILIPDSQSVFALGIFGRSAPLSLPIIAFARCRLTRLLVL